MTIATLGINIAKTVFQIHGVDADGTVLLQKKLRRGAVLSILDKLESSLIDMEACATSHHCAREIAALGHEVSNVSTCGSEFGVALIRRLPFKP